MLFNSKIESFPSLSKGLIYVALMLLSGGFMLLCFRGWTMLSGQQTLCQLKALQAMQAFFVFLFPCFIAVCMWSKHPLRWLHMDRGFGWQEGVLIVCMMILAQPGINLLSHLNQQLVLPSFLSDIEVMLQEQEDAAAILTEQFLHADHVGVMLFNLILMALLPALGEECCFRGVCQGLMDGVAPEQAGMRTRLSARTHIAIWGTAAIFSLAHFQFYGFVPRMLLGALLGYLLVWTGSLWASVLAHFTNNALVVVLYYICEHTDKINTESVDNFGFGDTLWAGMCSICLAAGMLWLIYNIVKRRERAISGS